MQVSMAKFKSHLADYVRHAQSGLVVEVTSHRKVVARLAGVAQSDGTAASRLVAAGVATWQGGKPVGAALRLTDKGALVSSMVLADRN
jgi:prevent-host-death family protein